MGITDKVKNAATHLKEGGADVVGTVKHGKGETDSGANNASGKTNTQAAKEQAANAARNAKGALRGDTPAATGEEYTNATAPAQQTAHPEGTTGAGAGTTSTHDDSTVEPRVEPGPDALGGASSHTESAEVIRPPGEGARIVDGTDARSFTGVGGATDDYKHTASGTKLRMAEGGLGSAEAVAPILNEPRPGVETYGSSSERAQPEPQSLQSGYNTHTPMVQTTGEEGRKTHTGAGVDDEKLHGMSVGSGSASGVRGDGGVGDTQGMPKDEAALMGVDAPGTGLQQSGDASGAGSGRA